MGAGPAGIYAADILDKSDADVTIDLFERMPAPFGLIRYGVAPDHPRIKGIVTALHKVLDKPNIRLLGNIDYGTDIKLEELQEFYDAVIFSTGASADRALDIPGIELDGSYGAADFVSWYDGHPDVPRTWPLNATSVAVLGVGNVALDVARVLAKTADELLPTDIPDNVYQGLKASPITDVHVFGRRGPAQAKFTPLELRELDHSPNVEVIVSPEDIEFDDGSIAALRASKQIDMVVKTLQEWAIREPGTRPRRLHLHFFHSPSEILGAGRAGDGPADRTHRADRRRKRARHGRIPRLGRPGGVPRGRLPVVPPAGDPVRPRQRRGPEPGGPRAGPGREPAAGRVRDGLDQARPDRPHRPHEGRRGGDDREPAFGRGHA